MIYITLNTDLDDIYDELSTLDKKQLVDYLEEDGYLKGYIKTSDTDPLSIGERIYKEKIDILPQLYHRLSNEDEEIILNIIKKYE